MKTTYCIVCGSKDFKTNEVLWPELIQEWNLNEEEALYVNMQQGFACKRCGNNLRSMVLARALLDLLGSGGSLDRASRRFRYRKLRILEVNEAGNLSPFLSRFSGHRLVSYPESDMTSLQFDDGYWDLIIHSDTLEHIPEPLAALRECWRVLRVGGACIFTVPIIIGRMSRSRDGMKPSYHGNPVMPAEDYRVATEFGADVWTYVMKAGFKSCKFYSQNYPAGIAVEAIK